MNLLKNVLQLDSHDYKAPSNLSCIGLGQLIFGMPPESTIPLLGNPSDVTFSRIDGVSDHTETWNYANLNVKLEFSLKDSKKLSKILIYSPDFKVMDTIQVGQSVDEVKKHIEALKIGAINYQDWSDLGYPGHSVIQIANFCQSFWFDDSRLVEIQCQPLTDEDGETIWSYNADAGTPTSNLEFSEYSTDEVFISSKTHIEAYLKTIFSESSKYKDIIESLPNGASMDNLYFTPKTVTYHLGTDSDKNQGTILASLILFHKELGQIGIIATELDKDMNPIKNHIEF